MVDTVVCEFNFVPAVLMENVPRRRQQSWCYYSVPYCTDSFSIESHYCAAAFSLLEPTRVR